MKKLLLIPMACIALHMNSDAQTVKFGINAGVAFSNYDITVEGTAANGKTKTGFAAGILADISINKNFSFQPAVNFVQKGTKLTGGEDNNTVATLTVNHIEVPLNFVFKAPGSAGDFFIGAGPSFAYGISGTWGLGNGTESFSEKIKFGNTEDDDMKRIDVGANFLAGYRFNRGLLLSVNYNLGLNNLLPTPDNGSMKAHYFGIKLGFLFGGSDKK